MKSNSLIRVENVSKDFKLPHEKHSSLKSKFINTFRSNQGYDLQHALSDISFEVKEGEFFGIVGRNGSGKSTLLKIIAGIYQPTQGTVSVEGKLVPFIELGVGFNPELTGKENVYLNGALLGFDDEEIDKQYEDIVKFAELDQYMGQKLKNYSSGMQVRLAFSMAVRARADILLIDEVLAVGDADFQRKCFNYFNTLKKAKKTVVFVSHNMDAIREYCDRALLIEKSKVVKIGSTDAISEKYLRLFMGESVSLSRAEPQEQNRWGDHAIRVVDISSKVTGKTVTIRETIKAKQDIEHPIAGFRIRDAAGNDVAGTNTKVENKRLPDFKKGEVAVITWELPNFLRDGQYSIDPAILHSDEVTVADWWNDAAYFEVKKDRHLPYPTDPGFAVSVKMDGQ